MYKVLSICLFIGLSTQGYSQESTTKLTTTETDFITKKKGKFYLDNHSLNFEKRLGDWFKILSYVPQNIFLFNDTPPIITNQTVRSAKLRSSSVLPLSRNPLPPHAQKSHISALQNLALVALCPTDTLPVVPPTPSTQPKAWMA